MRCRRYLHVIYDSHITIMSTTRESLENTVILLNKKKSKRKKKQRRGFIKNAYIMIFKKMLAFLCVRGSALVCVEKANNFIVASFQSICELF